MSSTIPAAEQYIIDTLLTAICTAPHDKRTALFRQAHWESIQTGYTGWAMLCRGFDHLVEENYEFINETLYENLESHSCDGSTHGPKPVFWALRFLLFAHTNRRRADQAMDYYKRNLYEDREELHRRIDWAFDEADAFYRELTDQQKGNRDKRIAAVANHGAAKLAYLKVRYQSIFEPNPEQSFLFSDKLSDAKEAFTRSVKIAENAGFDYAPPMNGMAWLHWIEFWENREAWSRRHRVQVLEGCRDWAARAIGASHETYAPPMLLLAAVRHRLRMEKGEAPDRAETADLINSALRISPYDSMTQNELDSFSHALRDDTEAGRVDRDFYRAIRIAEPAGAMKASLNRYLSSELSSSTTVARNQLLVLRRWSSYTPLIKLREHVTVGGGYYLEWGSTRIAIDPGVGFVRNFYRYGYHIQDLQAVVVTHQHIDHTDDTEAILSILKTCTKEKMVGNELPRFYLTKSGMERWEKMIVSALELPSSKALVEELSPAADGTGSTNIDDVELFPVPLHAHPDAIDEAPDLNERGEPVSKNGRPPTGCGLIFKLPDKGDGRCVVGITSDTGYLSDSNATSSRRRRASEYYKDCDIIVLHISTVDDCYKRSELEKEANKYVSYPCDWAESNGYSGFLYKKHLGFWGVVIFIRDLLIESRRSDRTYVLSEFGEETLKNRVPILNEICSLIESLGPAGVEQAKRIHLGDVGTQVRLPQGNIGCNFGLNRCSNDADRFLEFDASSGDLSIPHRGWNDRALAHFCREHDSLFCNPCALNPAFWDYSGYPVINDELLEARLRTSGQTRL